jgi:4-amino-4-deoxy-L-arabinose transferase-like glycosyltransferase
VDSSLPQSLANDAAPAQRASRVRTLLTGVALALVCLLLLVPGFFTIPAVDRDESRFAQASRQMLESGDIVVPMVVGTPRLNKPPLIYWVQAGVTSLLTGGDASRDAIWMYRLPSLLAAVGIALLAWRIAGSFMGPWPAFLAGACTALVPVMAWEARQARADMVLVLFTTGAMATLWSIMRDARRTPAWKPLLLWTLTGLGVLTKGPITPLVVVTCLVCVSAMTARRDLLRRVRPVLGIAVVLAVGAPWLLAVMARVGPAEYWRLVFDETLGRSMEAKEGHWGPPGYHLLLSPLLLFPASLGIGAGLAAGFNAVRVAIRVRRAATPASPVSPASPAPVSPALFLTCWIVPSWIVFELVSTKLPHYTMPLTPAAVVLCVHGLASSEPWAAALRGARWAGVALRGGIIAAMITCLAAWLLSAGTIDDQTLLHGPSLALSLLYGVLSIAAALAMFRLLRSGRHVDVLGVAALLFGLSSATLIGSADAIAPAWTSRRVVALRATLDPSGVRPFAAVGFDEDSLIFESRGKAQRVTIDALPAWLERHPDGLVCITEPLLAKVPSLRSLAATRGFNYAKGQRVEVVLAALTPAGSDTPLTPAAHPPATP